MNNVVGPVFQTALTFGIADGSVTKCNETVADDDFLRINETEIEGRSAAEVLSDISAAARGANSDITSIYNTSLKMGRDSHNLIDFATTDNKIIFRVEDSDTDGIALTKNFLTPGSNDGCFLGSTSLRWSDLFLASGGVINFGAAGANRVTITHSSVTLAIAGLDDMGATAAALTVTGDITALTSDKRLKTNIEIIESPLDKINKLSGFTYNWDKEKCEKAGFIPKDEEQIGVFAQDVQSVIPQAVKPAPFDTDGDGNSKSGDNYLTVQYEKIVPLLIECIKDQQKQIDELKKDIMSLK